MVLQFSQGDFEHDFCDNFKRILIITRCESRENSSWVFVFVFVVLGKKVERWEGTEVSLLRVCYCRKELKKKKLSLRVSVAFCCWLVLEQHISCMQFSDLTLGICCAQLVGKHGSGLLLVYCYFASTRVCSADLVSERRVLQYVVICTVDLFQEKSILYHGSTTSRLWSCAYAKVSDDVSKRYDILATKSFENALINYSSKKSCVLD